jgi:hypothetical protein
MRTQYGGMLAMMLGQGEVLVIVVMTAIVVYLVARRKRSDR